jgi:hypothetical protein
VITASSTARWVRPSLNAASAPASGYNSENGAVLVTRTGTGTYTVTFSTLVNGLPTGAEGLALVTSLDDAVACSVPNVFDFDGSPPDVDVVVRCFAMGSGASVNARFKLMYLN